MRKTISSIFICLCFLSCDPSDNRLSFKNNTKDSLVIRLLFEDEIVYPPRSKQRAGAIEVFPNQNKEIGVFDRWEGQFEEVIPDSTISVIVMKKFDYYSNPKKWDSLYSLSHYFIKKYTLKDFKNKKWKINYPEDGFRSPKSD